MRLLVFGGTVFLSRAVAAAAVEQGHEVICAARGASGSVPDGATLLTVDRTAPLPDLAGFDAVIDVARHPSWVRRALAATTGAHWVFVSTVNVYADDATPGGRPGTTPLVEPRHEDADLAADPEAYGPMKRACEELVEERGGAVVRPGLIVGPGDPTGRFTYWPHRVAGGGEVLAPGDPGDVVQVIDVRDLATWLVDLARTGTTGTFDGVGRPRPIADVLSDVVAACGPASLTWVPSDFLTAQGVEPWSGPDAIPLWLPRPAYDGMLARDVQPALDAGLALRPLTETARDTLAAEPSTGIGREREAEVLAAWRTR